MSLDSLSDLQVLIFATFDPAGRKLAQQIADYSVTIEHYRRFLEINSERTTPTIEETQAMQAHHLTIQSTLKLQSDAVAELIRKSKEHQSC